MLLNILQCTENATSKNHVAQNVSRAKAEKPCSSTTSGILSRTSREKTYVLVFSI